MPELLISPARSLRSFRRVAARLAALAALGLVAGAVAGLLWWWLVDLPSYRVGEDGAATTSERDLAAVIGSDAWYGALGLAFGIGIGLLAWRWLGRLGWPVVVVALLVALAGGVVCWVAGSQLGPGPFDPRLAAARPGDLVPIPLTLHTRASLLSWPLGAVLPIMLAASLGPEQQPEQEPERMSE